MNGKEKKEQKTRLKEKCLNNFNDCIKLCVAVFFFFLTKHFNPLHFLIVRCCRHLFFSKIHQYSSLVDFIVHSGRLFKFCLWNGNFSSLGHFYHSIRVEEKRRKPKTTKEERKCLFFTVNSKIFELLEIMKEILK